MPPTPDELQDNRIPLVVDLDGTLIKTDLLWEFLARLLRRNPLWLFPIIIWWIRGRAFLKRQLANRVKIDPATLPYHEKFLAFLREQKNAGRKLILATASDLQMALPVADHIGLFDEVLGSDGKTNLRSKNKLKVLVEKFGERGFDYAGNSVADLAIWHGARQAIVVNASRAILKQAAACAKIAASFPENYSPFSILKSFLNELFIRSGYLVAVLAGLLLVAAFPKIGIAGFAWVAPALILFAAHGKKSGDAFRVGYVAGLSFWLSSLYWLLLIPVAGFPILGWILLSAVVALYFGIWTWLLAGKIGEVNWAATEPVVARRRGNLGRARNDPLRGCSADFRGTCSAHHNINSRRSSKSRPCTGVYGVSFLVVWFSLSLFSAGRMVFAKPDSRFAWQPEVFLPLLAVAIIFAFGSFKMHELPPSASNLRVTLIQPSVPQTMIWDETENTNRFRQLLALSENALTNQTDLLIWPESALPEFNDESLAAITNLIRTHHVWMIFNADDAVWRPNPKDKDDFDVFNAAFLFDPDGNCAAIYHKQRLVIFGEYVPLARWLPFLKWFTPITGGYKAGNFPVQFEINLARTPREPLIEVNNVSSAASPRQTVKTSPLICFEDIFPQTARAAVRDDTDFLVNLTNDGWFGQSAQQWQHMANAVFRAVENGVPLIRCTNNGVTCWIDSYGVVREIFKDQTGGVYGIGSMAVQIPLPSEKPVPTFYNRHGDWFGWSSVMVTAVILLFRLKKMLALCRI